MAYSKSNSFKNSIKKNFTVVPNSVLTNDNISWKAKGIFSYLASKQDDWNFYVGEIQQNATDGETALKSGLKELENSGYLTRKPNQNDQGQFSGWVWILKIPDGTVRSETHPTGNPPDGKPTGWETTLYTNTDNTNKEKNNTEYSSVAENSNTSQFPNCAESENIEAAKRICNHLIDAIITHDSAHRYGSNSPDITTKNWAPEIEKALRLDGRSEKQLTGLIDFLFTTNHKIANFWRPNIQSGKKLREQFDRIKGQVQSNPEYNKKAKTSKMIKETVDDLF